MDIEEFDPLPAHVSDAAELPECEQDREVREGPSRQALGDSDDAASYAPVSTPLPKEDQPFDPDLEKQMVLEAMGCKTESDSGSFESSAGLDESGRGALLGVPKPMASTRFLQRAKSRMLHMMRDCDAKLLLCGRVASDDYKPSGVIRYDSSVCRNCRRAVQAQPA